MFQNSTVMISETSRRTVMLIDDDEIDNYVNKKLILATDFADEVFSYRRAHHALRHLQDREWMAENRPGYIFLDLNMPGMNGLEFMAELCKLPAECREGIRVVVLSNALRLPEELTQYDLLLACFSKPMIKSNLDRITQIDSNMIPAERRSVFARGFSFFDKTA